jgi:hypothetical protein
MRSILLLTVAFMLWAGLAWAGDRQKPVVGKLGYVRIEAKGKLLHRETAYYVEAADAAFSDFKVLVKLERSEDKNRQLDGLLASLEGKVVVVEGYMDCRRVGEQEKAIWLYLHEESQIKAADKE